MPRIISPDQLKARTIIASPAGNNPQELHDLAKRLMDANNLEYAQKLLTRALADSEKSDRELRHEILRRLALCTYKNPDEPVAERLTAAAQILEGELLPDQSLSRAQRQDALGIAGAVYKSRWQVYGLRQHLEKAVEYYRSGMEFGIQLDTGYTAINAAFVLDLLAAGGGSEKTNGQLILEGEEIRNNVRDTLLRMGDQNPELQHDFWFLATLTEACLGLKRYDEARENASNAAKCYAAGEPYKVAPWQLETTARQLTHLARLVAASEGTKPENLEYSKSWPVLHELLGKDGDAALSFLRGKVGLALSGGGFRASLYHIGVLAKLAELDMLRHVEVISSVSGGSIIGAYYYLELRCLLQTKADQAINRQDYIELIDRIQVKFLAGIQRNIRLRMLMEFGTNLKVLTSRRSSMTDRLADLYDRELYSQIDDEFDGQQRRLSELKILPRDCSSFNPKYDNWRRKNKVPILILNATTLNTCHNWQFTTSFMGEPPARSIDTEIDGNDRLRRMYHDEAPERYRENIRLSEAVAASACVPGLFDPLTLDQLYGTTFDPQHPENFVTRLVDGGTYDNQGISSLREQDCSVLLVSDACGQTGIAFDPGGGRLGVTKRTNDILMARVREAQYQYLAALRDAGTLRGVMYVHLKKGLEAVPVDWLDCPDHSSRVLPPVLTRYAIRQDVQKLLAGIRTDLDAFSDVEADTLMLSGYLMTASEFDECIKGFPISADPQYGWRFRTIAQIAGDPKSTAETASLKRSLKIGSEVALKPWLTSTALKTFGVVALGSVLALGIYLCRKAWDVSVSVPFGRTVVVVAALGVILTLFRKLLDKIHYRNSYAQIVASTAMCVGGWILLRLHLWLIEPMYVHAGPKYRHLPIDLEAEDLKNYATGRS